MNTLLRIIFVLSIAVFAVSNAPAQGDKRGPAFLTFEKGVEAHKGIDRVYAEFAKGYRTLDASLVAGLYSEDAAYLPPGIETLIGRAAIAKNFGKFFDSIKAGKGRLEISFHIVQRQVDKNLAYDVGVYTLTSYNGDGISTKGQGKFVVVAKREKGIWLFQVDGYNDLPK
jgi:conserved hypothetical protein